LATIERLFGSGGHERYVLGGVIWRAGRGHTSCGEMEDGKVYGGGWGSAWDPVRTDRSFSTSAFFCCLLRASSSQDRAENEAGRYSAHVVGK
jgi:hypothetical protein